MLDTSILQKRIELQQRKESVAKQIGFDLKQDYIRKDYTDTIIRFIRDDLKQSLGDWILNMTLAYKHTVPAEVSLTEGETVCVLDHGDCLSVSYLKGGKIIWEITEPNENNIH